MGRKYNPDAIPDSAIWPTCMALCEIQSIDEDQSSTGKLMYVGHFRGMEPKTIKGLMLNPENFVVGNDDDPQWQDPETVTFGLQRLKRVMKCSGIQLGDDLDEDLHACQGQQVLIDVYQIVDDGERDPRYKGMIRNRIRDFHTPGEREIGVVDEKPTGAAKAPAKPVAAPTRERSAVAAAAAPASKAAPKATPKATPKPDDLKCSICAGVVARKDFAAHVAAHDEEDEE